MSILDQRLHRLSDTDLEFIVRTVTVRRTDHDQILATVRGKPDLIEVMLSDPRLFDRVVGDQDILLRISPYLLFSILLTRAQQDLEKSSFTVELGAEGRVAVFDAPEAARLAADREVKGYLADMLASFTRTESTQVTFRQGRSVVRRSYSDMDVDDMIELSRLVHEEHRFPFYRRVGDVCLFLLGIFPEHAAAGTRVRLRGRTARGVAEYESLAQEFYRKAAAEEIADALGVAGILERLAGAITLVRKPLNLISQRYAPLQRLSWFAPGAGIEQG